MSGENDKGKIRKFITMVGRDRIPEIQQNFINFIDRHMSFEGIYPYPYMRDLYTFLKDREVIERAAEIADQFRDMQGIKAYAVWLHSTLMLFEMAMGALYSKSSEYLTVADMFNPPDNPFLPVRIFLNNLLSMLRSFLDIYFDALEKSIILDKISELKQRVEGSKDVYI